MGSGGYKTKQKEAICMLNKDKRMLDLDGNYTWGAMDASRETSNENEPSLSETFEYVLKDIQGEVRRAYEIGYDDGTYDGKVGEKGNEFIPINGHVEPALELLALARAHRIERLKIKADLQIDETKQRLKINRPLTQDEFTEILTEYYHDLEELRSLLFDGLK